MHEPLVLAYHVRVLDLDVWHREPGGHDSGEVCGQLPHRQLPRLWWVTRHSGHLYLRWWPYLNVRRWVVDRCEDCGGRFRWREGRHSYMGTDKVWHAPCMSLCHVRSQLDDLTGYVRGTADSDARWRAEYRLKALDAKDGGGE